MRDSTKNDIFRQEWYQKSGKIPFPMTNDYLFRALCQKDTLALQSLICSILHWELDQIVSAEVTNPILLGKAIDEKEFILDVHVKLNNDIVMNMEMQVMDYGDWPERSLQYLCRQFDQLGRGDLYEQSKTAIHIGILGFDPLEGKSSLCESYRMMSQRTHLLYTDKFQLYTLCLTQLEQTTDEDLHYHTEKWVRYFTAKTWEDLKMLAKEDKGVASAISTANALMEDEEIRARKEAREDYDRRMRTEQAKMKKLEKQLAEKDEELARKDEALNAVREKQQSLEEKRQRLEKEIESLRNEIAEKKHHEQDSQS
jgi:predicted transposase/invertase (TIGR01784 family)